MSIVSFFQLDKWKRLEESGRQRASRRDEPPFGDMDFLFEIADAAYDMRSILRKINMRDWSSFAGALEDTALILARKAGSCERQREYRGSCFIDPEPFEWLDKSYKEASGKERCTWLRSVKKPYDLASGINDLTACFHRLIEKITEEAGKWRKEGKCLWRIS